MFLLFCLMHLYYVVFLAIVSWRMVKYYIKVKKYGTLYTHEAKCYLVKVQHTKILNYDYIWYMIKNPTWFKQSALKPYAI